LDGGLLAGIPLIVVGVIGAEYDIPTLPLALCLTIGTLALDLVRRQPRTLRLVDFWRLAFVYLFGSDVLLTVSDVRADFGLHLASAAEGFLVAAFGASLVGYALGRLVGSLQRPRLRAAVHFRTTPQRVAVFGLSTLIVLYVALAVPPRDIMTMRGMREGTSLQGQAFGLIVAAMILQGAITSQAFMTTRHRAQLVYPLAVTALSFVVIYGVGTRYFLGLFGSGILFYYSGLMEPLSRRRIVAFVLAVLALAAAQGTMRLARVTGFRDAQAGSIASSLTQPETYLSSEGMLRVNTWVHEKRVFAQGGRAPEHAFLLYWWVPRNLWSSKPTMDGYWLAHEVMADGDVGAAHSVAGGFSLPALLDFGPKLGIAVCLLYGLALYGLESFVARHRDPRDPASVIAAVLPFAVFFAMRSPQTIVIFVETCIGAYLPILAFLRAFGRRFPAGRPPLAMYRNGHGGRTCAPRYSPAHPVSVRSAAWPATVRGTA
jgi:hypothetical protein